MADEPTNTRRVLWETAFNKLTELNQKLDHCPAKEREALERAIAEKEEDLLDTPAPSFDAVRIKLERIFDGQLIGIDPESEYRRLVLEDLSDLIAEMRELIGSEPTAQLLT